MHASVSLKPLCILTSIRVWEMPRRRKPIGKRCEGDTVKFHAATLPLELFRTGSEAYLPDPDTLVQGDDFSVFMAKAVPDRIRRRALRSDIAARAMTRAQHE